MKKVLPPNNHEDNEVPITLLIPGVIADLHFYIVINIVLECFELPHMVSTVDVVYPLLTYITMECHHL